MANKKYYNDDELFAILMNNYDDESEAAVDEILDYESEEDDIIDTEAEENESEGLEEQHNADVRFNRAAMEIHRSSN